MQASATLPASDARRALLASLVDYAGLFPPAGLGMAAAVVEYLEARAGTEGWLLGRFVCPASRLTELAEALPPETATLALSVVLDGADMRDDLARVDRLPLELVRAEVVEVRLPAGGAELVAALDALLDSLPSDDAPVPYVEPTLRADWREAVPRAVEEVARRRKTLHGARLGLKLRCGGTVATAFPSPAQVALFVASCRSTGVPIKATAGLHHPIRHVDPATGFHMHGFLNLLAAAVFTLDETELADVLLEEDPAAFRLDEDGLAWRDLSAGTAALARARRELFVAFGSCSFAEPVEDLGSLGFLASA